MIHGSRLFLDLPSNSSLKYFPNNKASSYITKLSQPLHLQGKWKVGLVNISYPKYNVEHVNKNNLTIKYYIGKSETEPGQIRYHFFNYKIKGLESEKFVENFVEDFNSWSERVSKGNSIRFFIDDNHVHLIVPELSILGTAQFLCIPTFLSNLFNYPTKDLYNFNDTVHVSYSISPKGPYRSLFTREDLTIYIYSDCIRDQIVGDTMAPLLRTFTMKKGGIDTEFNQILYKEIEKGYIETIEINLRTEYGDLVSFESNTLSVTLHFKRA